MSKTATVRARIEPDLKDRVEHVFRQLGLTATQAITLFYKQPAQQCGTQIQQRTATMTDPDILQTILKDSSFDLSPCFQRKKSTRCGRRFSSRPPEAKTRPIFGVKISSNGVKLLEKGGAWLVSSLV